MPPPAPLSRSDSSNSSSSPVGGKKVSGTVLGDSPCTHRPSGPPDGPRHLFSFLLTEGANGAVVKAERPEVGDHHGGQAREPEQERAGHAQNVRGKDKLLNVEDPSLMGPRGLPQVREQ